MKFINKVWVATPRVNQEFELGDLTIFIGRPNSGKTRILRHIFQQSQQAREITQRYNGDARTNNLKNNGILSIGSENVIKKMNSLMIDSRRGVVNNIDNYTDGLNRVSDSAKKMDPTIDDFGNHGIKQLGDHRNLEIQGSGIQNSMQIISKINQNFDFILIDEPEISQFPTGKIEVLRRVLEVLGKKQILLATHDPTLINQYLIKKLMGDTKHKIIIYSFCGDSFKKIDFNSNLDPEIHCGYLSQTFSGKPIHLVVEGQTEFYVFQALLHKYCLEKKIIKFPERINKINLSYLAGNQWKINLHHLPPPEHYDVLMILDGDKTKEVSSHKFGNDFKIINSIDEINSGKVNVLCLKAKNIEKAFEGIFSSIEKFSKPFELSEAIWKSTEGIIDKLKENSEESSQIYGITHWAINKSKGF